MGIERDLETARLDIGKTIVKILAAHIDPGGQTRGLEARIARLRRKEEDVLPGRNDAASDDVGEKLGQPRAAGEDEPAGRSEEHTSELQSLMRNSYAVFCLKKKTIQNYTHIQRAHISITIKYT